MMTADFLTLRVPVYLAAVGCLWVAVTCILYGIDLYQVALSKSRKAKRNNVYRRLVYTLNMLETALATAFCFCFGLVFLSLGFIYIRSDISVPVWAFAILIVASLSATWAFIAYAGED